MVKKSLPVHNLVNDLFLLTAAPMQIDSGGLNAFMSQNIGQQRDIPSHLDKLFGKQVAEGMGVDNGRI